MHFFSDIGALDANQSGPSTHEKRNRKKRAAISLNQVTNKKLKIDDEHLDAYKKLVAKRIRKKPTIDSNGKLKNSESSCMFHFYLSNCFINNFTFNTFMCCILFVVSKSK